MHMYMAPICLSNGFESKCIYMYLMSCALIWYTKTGCSFYVLYVLDELCSYMVYKNRVLFLSIQYMSMICVVVYITSISDNYFKGFMMKVEDNLHRSTGYFDANQHANIRRVCGTSSSPQAVTHRDSQAKNSVTARWLAISEMSNKTLFYLRLVLPN